MDSQYLMGIDVGTSLIKTAIYNLSGRRMAFAKSKVSVQHPKSFKSEQSMLEVWDATRQSIRSCVEKSGINLRGLVALGCAGQGDGLWALDAEGRPVESAILWNDNRSVDVIRRWQSEGVLRQHFKKSGTVLWPGSTGAILRWLMEKNPDQYYKIKTVFNAKDWINYRLTGIMGTDETDASIPFMDVSLRIFSQELAELMGLADIRRVLPKVALSTDIQGVVTKQAATETGLRAGIPVVHGLLDVAASVVGANTTVSGEAFTILGTTLLNAFIMDSPVFQPINVGATVCGAFPGQWLRVLGAETGTPNLDWFSEQMGGNFAQGKQQNIFNSLEQRAAATPVGAHGVLYHPFINGERAPFLNLDASSAFLGIREHITISDLARAVFEGTAMSFKHCLVSIGMSMNRIVATGGGSRNNLWCQILSDSSGCEIAVPSGDEFGTQGAAVVSAVGVGLLSAPRWLSDDTEQSSAIPMFVPRHENQKRYDELFHLYQTLISALEPFWHSHAKIVSGWKNNSDEAGQL